MTRNPFRLGLLSAALLCAPLRAEDPGLRELLRDALYTEEVTRDPDAAAKQYEEILSRHAEQQAFAASALFRLAEVRRKQDRKDDAIALYQRLLREFPAAVTEAKLAAENLAALGAEVPEAGEALSDEESKELLRLKALEKTGPDLLKDPKALENAARNGWLRVAGLLLDAGNDPYRSPAFTFACTRGYLEICRLMLEKRGNPPEHVVNDAMAYALHEERLEVVKFLLQKGFKPDPAELLAISVRKRPSKWDRETTSLLLKAGADLNLMPAETSEPFPTDERWLWSSGTPLHDALSWRNIEAANFLLDQRCKPDLPTPSDGITPLHIALYLEEKGATDLIRRLLAAGADPNRRTLSRAETQTPPDAQPIEAHRSSQWEDLSPLEIAIDFPSVENAKLLLDAGAKTDSSRVWEKAFSSKKAEFIDLLLQSDTKPPLPELLAMAVKYGNLSAVTRLLDAGASPQAPGLLEDAVRTRNLPLVQLLFERGVVPDEGWVRGELQKENWREIKPLLFQRFLIPLLLEKPAITFFSPVVGWNSTQELATQAGSTPPSPLPELLLAAKQLSWPSATFPVTKGANSLTRWRKDEQGKPAAVHVRLDGPDPLPDLQWGDVIALDFDPKEDAKAGPVPLRNVEFRDKPTPEIAWALQRRISFPVTLEIDGVGQDLTLRGDRLIHDPTSKEVPLCTAGALAGLRWQPGMALGDMGMTLTITRKEWPEVRLSYPSDEASLFILRAGDHVKLETTPKVTETLTAGRKEYIGFRAAGLPFALMLPCATRRNGNLEYPAPMLPTLCQLIAQSQAVPAEWSQFTELSADWIPAKLRSSAVPETVLPHPDWSRIRILRLKEDGSEEAIEVNLSRWLEEAGPNATAEEIKKRDIPLQPGDIVELRVHEDRLGQPWKGISPAEEAFLAKALEGRVQIIGSDSQMRLEEIRFKAAAAVETPAGWIPLPSRSGVQSAQASSLLGGGDPIGVTRNGTNFGGLTRSVVFLLDGDQIKLSGGVRQPRERVLPPGPNR